MEKKSKKDAAGDFSKAKPLYSRESEAQLALQAMANSTTNAGAKDGYSFVPTGPGRGTGSGVYFIDFSEDYKKCLKLAREKLEKTEKLSQLEKMEIEWIQELKENRNKPIFEKLIFLKLDSPRMSPRSQSPRIRSKRERLSTELSTESAHGSASDLTQLEKSQPPTGGTVSPIPAKTEARKLPTKGKYAVGGKKASSLNKGVEYDAMGSKWNKSMWDNMENYWRMVMSNEEFEVTPGCYDRQLDSNYRFSQETVTFAHLEEARAKCLKWIHQNKEHFSL